MLLGVRAAGVVVAMALAVIASAARGGEAVLWANAPGEGAIAGNFSFVRVDGSGAETASNRCADDFVVPDPDGTGAPVVVTQVDTEIVSDGDPGADHEAIAEVWSDDAGHPGVRLHEFGAGRLVTLVQTSGNLKRWLCRFEGVAVALTPGTRYWLVIAVRTPDTSNQVYFRQRAQGVTGVIAHRILPGGSTPEKLFDVVQELRGYQVTACPARVVEGTVSSGSSNHAPTAAMVQSGRLVIGGAGSSCGVAEACTVSGDGAALGATVHSFWNSAGEAACVAVTLEQACGETGAHAAAYLTAYDTGDLCAGRAGDSGEVGGLQSFSFTVEPGAVFHVVVHEAGLGTGCAYTLRVRGLTACCEKCEGDANGDGVVSFNDLVEVLGLWLAVYPEPTGSGDATCDAAVNFMDVVAVLGNWLRVCADSEE